MQETIAGPGTHPKAYDPNVLIEQQRQDAVDPTIALERLVLQMRVRDTENQQLKTENEQMKQEVAKANAFVEKFEPYADIFDDTRTYLPVFLRNPVVFKRFLAKLRDIFGPLSDVNAPTEKGRKLANRTVDHAMGIVLEWVLLKWHEVKPRIEGTQYAPKV